MSSPASRLAALASHLWAPSSSSSTSSTSTTSSSSKTEQPPPQKRTNRHELSPTYLLPRAASIEPDAEAIVHTTATGKVLRRTYREFADRARGLGYFVRGRGYKRVGILCPNTPAHLESIFGIAAGGALQVAVNYRLKPEDIRYIFAHAEVEAIIVDREFVHLLDGFDEGVRRIIDDDVDATEGELSGGEFDDVIAEGLRLDVEGGAKGWEGLQMEAQHEDDIMALAYTSGTTAKPKGVEYTHRGIYLAALANVIESSLSPRDVMATSRAKYLTILPLFHAVGWTFPWAVVSARATHYCLRKIDYGEMWRLLKDEGVTHFNAAPTVNTLLCAHSSAVKLAAPVRVTVAASPPTAKLFADMIALNLIPVHVYGLTETYGPITRGYFLPSWHALPAGEKYTLMARQGHGFATSRLCRVIKPGISPPVDVARNGLEVGEIVFSGNICARGYHKDAAATTKLFADGVLHTEDLAVWHADGAVQIMDRAKDIIISGGENVSSVALEGLLVRHPDVLEVGVVAVPDSHFGERPKAFVTLAPGATTKGEEIVLWAKKSPGIAGFMVPREVEVVKELPKTSTGKIQKNVLRAWVKGGERAF